MAKDAIVCFLFVISQCASLYQLIKQLTTITIVDFNRTLAVYFVFTEE